MSYVQVNKLILKTVLHDSTVLNAVAIYYVLCDICKFKANVFSQCFSQVRKDYIVSSNSEFFCKCFHLLKGCWPQPYLLLILVHY